MNQKKIIKKYAGVGRIDSYNLPDVELRFCQYSDGEIRGNVKNTNDSYVIEFWNSLKNFPPLTIEGNTSSGDSFVFHSFYAAHPTTELVGKDFEVTKIGVVEDHREYDFKIEFGLLQLALYQIQQIKCDSPFGEFIISPVQNSNEILKEIKASEIYDVTSHISFTFTSSKENLEKTISEIVDYLEGVMILLSFAQGVFINYIYYNLYIKHAGGFELYKSIHNTAKTKITTSDELIWTPHIQNFLESVLPTFTKDFQERTGVGYAIEWYLESIRPSVIESKFIHACIAIELLNDRFKKKYFSWNDVPENDNKRLRRFLKDDFGVVWAETAKISKSTDGKTISIYKDGNLAEITIDANEEKATLMISDGGTHDLIVKKENSKLNIYKKNNSKDKGGILTDVEFKNLEEDVRNAISEQISDKGKRKKIYPKIRELNRPTLKNSLEDMYNFYVIGYSDLFQDFEFVEIRDNIIHAGLSKGDFKDLRENHKKLVALLQRTLLGMLNYTGEFIDQSDNWEHKKNSKKKMD